MAEKNLIELLDQAVDATLEGRRSDLALADPALATMLVLVADLRELPDPAFKARLKAELFPPGQEETMSTAPELEPGFHSIRPYLIVRGAAGLADFLTRAFGAVERFRAPRPDGTIIHAEVQLGDSMIELGDAGEQWQPLRFSLHLYVEDADATYQRAIAAGAQSLYPPMDQPYGDREAGVEDRFGNQWFIATHQKTAGVGGRPEGFRTVTPGLRVRGADRLLDFVKRAFQAREIDRTTMPDGTIIHATFTLGDSMVEAGEAHGPWEPMPSALHYFVDDVDAMYQRALEAGATSIMPPEDKPYGERGAAVADPFGNQWFIAMLI